MVTSVADVCDRWRYREVFGIDAATDELRSFMLFDNYLYTFYFSP